MLVSKEQQVSQGYRSEQKAHTPAQPLNESVFVGQVLASRLSSKKSQSKVKSVFLKLSSFFLSLFPYLICFLMFAFSPNLFQIKYF